MILKLDKTTLGKKRRHVYNRAFSLIEISVVLLIVGLLVAMISGTTTFINKTKLVKAVTLTKNAPVLDINDLVFWYEPVLQSSFDEGVKDGDLVVNWYDQNSKSYDKINLTQPTSTRQPKYVKDGINGLPTVEFYHNNQNNCIQSPPLSLFIREKHTIFLVVKSTNSSQAQEILKIHESLGGENTKGTLVLIRLQNNSGKKIRYFFRADLGNGSSGGEDAYSSNISNNVNSIIRVTRKDSLDGLNIWFNESQVITNDNSSGGNHGNTQKTNIAITLSGGRCQPGNYSASFRGYISEVIFYNRVLKNSEIIDIENYLSKKYSIAIE